MIERTFRAPIDEVWVSIVEPEWMSRWIGTWSGEDGTGNRVTFSMTAEEGAEPEEALIHPCHPPLLLEVEMFQGGASWQMHLSLDEPTVARLFCLVVAGVGAFRLSEFCRSRPTASPST